MFSSNNANTRILKSVGVTLLATTLIILPSLLENHLSFFSIPSLSATVNAQTRAPGSGKQELKREYPLPSAPIVGEKQQKTKESPSPVPADGKQERKSEGSRTQKGAKREKPGKIDVFKIVMGALAGLVLFLYGVTRMAEGLKAIAGDRMKNILGKFTKNRYTGVLTGAVATALLDSSSVTIIMTIALVDAGLLTFVQSLGVVMGSNIGTTFGGQIIAFKINQYAPIALFVGFLLQFFGKTDRQKQIGLIVFGIGLLFFGLDSIQNSMKPFQNYQPFIDWMQNLGENPLMGALVGALFTLLIQSSSATVGIVITLASLGLISLPAGVALILGAEVGTCADTLVATIGRSRQAFRTGVFHLFFNITTAAIGVAFAAQLAQLAEWISFGAGVQRQIANAQLIFNLLGVLLFIWFTPLIARGLEKLIPDSESGSTQQARPGLKSGANS